MRRGDPVVFWVTGRPDAPLTPGIWGVGKVTGPVEPASTDGDRGDYWLNTGRRDRSRLTVPVDITLMEQPIDREDIKATPGLSGLEVLRQAQMSNPSWLTREEWTSLREQLDEHAEPVGDDSSALPDAQLRSMIEEAAIDHVLATLKANDWTVEDVQKNNVGWDLTGRRGRSTRRVEVKGRVSRIPIVHLTHNELRAAREETDWRLAIVTGVLDRTPALSWFTGSDVLQNARPITYTADLTECRALDDGLAL